VQNVARKSSRTEGLQEWRRKLEKYCHSPNNTWDLAGIRSKCILCLTFGTGQSNNLAIAVASAAQILEEGTEISRYLWQCLNVVRA